MGRILVADDDSVHLCILQKILEKAGYEVVTVGDGVHAIDEYKKGEFNLVITDVFMPVMGGLELIREIKKINVNQKFLVITACPFTSSENYAQKSLDMGAHQVFSKPYNWQELLNTTQYLVDKTLNPEVQKDDGLSILVVDDNETIHESFRTIFSRAGKTAAHENINSLFDDIFESDNPTVYSDRDLSGLNARLDFACQGHEAVEKFSARAQTNHPYDFVFMDVRMPPGMDGIEATRKIKDGNPDAHVIICSAYSDYTWDEVIDKVGHTEGLSYLHKPFSAEVVKNIIQKDISR